MGNKEDWVTADNSFPSEEQLLSNMVYIQQGENMNQMLTIGKFNIYRFKKSPYELIMKHTRTFSSDNPKEEEYSRMSKVIASRIHHKNVAKIHSINTCSSICTKQIAIESYVNYYAINLQQMIEKRKINDTRFTSQELWYILYSLIELSSYLKKRQIYFGVYLARNIYLSHQGYLKIYLYHLNSTNNHILYYHMIKSNNRDMYKYLPIPPQCLPFLKQNIQQLKYVNLQKLDVFGIGMIALEAMLFNSTRKQYSSLSTTQHSFVFDQHLLKNDFKELMDIYPTKLIKLLQKMVCVDPKDRFSFEQARNYINSIRLNTTMNGSIKMIDDYQNPIQPKISYRQVNQLEYNKILKNITHNQINGQSKLRFIPLRQLSRGKRKNKVQICNVSHMGLSVQTTKKKKKLSLSSEKKKKEVEKSTFLDCSSRSMFRC